MAVFAYLLATHLGIVVDMFVLGKPLGLYLSSAYNPLANGGTAFGLFPLGKFFKRYGIDLYVYLSYRAKAQKSCSSTAASRQGSLP